METMSLGPVVSGLVGGVLATLLCSAWSRWVPEVCNRKSASVLLRQNRPAIWTVNAIFFAGIGLALWLYNTDYFPSNDWRGLGFGLGIGCASVFLILPLFSLVGGRSPKEAFVAYAIAQRTPIFVLYTILVFGVSGLVASLASTFGT